MTKKVAHNARRAAYEAALADNRVVRFPELNSFRSFNTIEARDAAIAEAVENEIVAEIVT